MVIDGQCNNLCESFPCGNSEKCGHKAKNPCLYSQLDQSYSQEKFAKLKKSRSFKFLARSYLYIWKVWQNWYSNFESYKGNYSTLYIEICDENERPRPLDPTVKTVTNSEDSTTNGGTREPFAGWKIALIVVFTLLPLLLLGLGIYCWKFRGTYSAKGLIWLNL